MHDCVTLLRHIHTTLKNEFNHSLESLDLTLSQFEVLQALKHADEGISLKELEKRIHVAQSTTTGIVSRMEQKGMVTLTPDPRDRRAKVISVTHEGRLLADRASVAMKETGHRLFGALTETELQILQSLLQKMARNVMPSP